MTEQEKREYIRRVMLHAKSDDLERAEAAFRGADLTQQYGYSGSTRGEILEEYREGRRRWTEVNEYLESILGPEQFGRHIKPGWGTCPQCGGTSTTCTRGIR